MPSLSKYTQWKVIGGYSLLFLLSILAAVLIYKQITKLIVNEENSDNPNRKLFIIGNTITGLYESEGLGNAFVQTGSRSYFLKYRDLIEEVESNIDSLRDLTTRLDQILRLDTIDDLLDQKIRNLQDIVRVKQSFVPDDFYNKAIASIESGRDSLQGTDIRKRHITTLDSSYTKSEKKKRRWLFFSKTEPDSVLKVSVSHHTVIDTLNRQTALQNTDSVVHILKTAWEDVQKQTQDITRQINRKEYALIQQSTYITDQLKRILGAYEKEEITNSLIKQETREQTLNTMIRIFAWLAVIAFLLILFFTFFILRDLSRSQRYRKELEAANRYADQLLKSREKMILTVTHDIKSPLSSVIGYIELLNNTPINERQRYFLKNMRGSSEHILKLIGNLLDLSKLENNKMPVEHIVFNPYHLFQEITDNFMPLAAAKHLELKARFSEDLDKDYSGDALRIRQILTNILSNAVKYTTTGHISFSAETVNPEKPVLARGILGTVMVLLGFLSWGFTYALAAADGDGGPTPWKALNSIAVGWPLGIGAALAVIGVIVTGPAYVSTAGAVLGWLPSKVFTVTGRLAQRNISRSKRRTSNTAAALFVGVAIVSCLGVVATSAKASVNSLVDTGLKADFAVSSASAGQIPDQAIKDIKKVDGVNHVVSNRVVLGVKYDGKAINGFTFATQPELFTKIFAAETTEGDAAAALKDGKLLVGKTIADDRGWHVGQKVKATAENIVVDKEATAKAQADYQAKVQAHVQELQSQAQQLAASGDLTGAQAKASEIEQYTNDAKNVDPKTLVKTKKVTTGKTLTIGAIVSNSVYRDFAIVNDDLAEQIGNKQTMFVMQAFVTDKRGADTAQVKKALKKTIKKYYTIVVFDRDEYKSTMSSMIDQMLMVLYALLALSIIIAIFGIVNTLALSVSERTKEIGLLRAIGTSRGQVRGMLGIEAAIISVFGTVLGLVVGVAAGVVIRAVYASEGLETLAIPWLQLLVFLLLSIVVGLVSSISPASRALKQPVLDAVASE